MTKKANGKKLSTAEQQMRDFLNAMATMNARIAQSQPIARKVVQRGSTLKQSKQPKQPQSGGQMAMSPFPMQSPNIPTAVCSRCGHTFKPEKIVRECPECGLTVAEEKDEELEWTSEMKEPIPDFVYKAQSPEEIFYKSIKWHYDKWMKILKNNPSASIGKI